MGARLSLAARAKDGQAGPPRGSHRPLCAHAVPKQRSVQMFAEYVDFILLVLVTDH